jgi:aminomethyltransferase
MTFTTVHDKIAPTAPDRGDIRAELSALVTDCGVYRLGGRAKISIRGADRTRWLNGMITNNIRDLGPGRGVYAFLLNSQGHILGDLCAYNRGEALMLDTDQAQLAKLLATFDHYIIMDDVEVEDMSDKLTALGVSGPKSQTVLQTAGFALPAAEGLQSFDIQWQGLSVTVVRGDNPAVESWELWLDPAQAELVRQAILAAGAKPVGSEALDLLRIAAGIPRYGQDIRERDLPQETGQQRALHFSKGCYIGQEIVERIRSRGAVHRTFTGFRVREGLPTPGATIQCEGKEVGEITSSASLPGSAGEMLVALGYLRREAALPGKKLSAGGSQLAIAVLPFAEIFAQKNH